MRETKWPRALAPLSKFGLKPKRGLVGLDPLAKANGNEGKANGNVG